jgi:hypothetical protein
MRIKQDYVLKQIGEDIIIVPIKNEAIRFNGIITVNKTAKFMFLTLQAEDLSSEELIKRVMNNYEVDETIAKRDVLAFIEKCQKNGLLNE